MVYKEMLSRAYTQMPVVSTAVLSRFELPRVRGHIQGNRTIISNFQQIADTLGRPVEHLLKYTLRELATPGELTKTALIIGTKISASRINEKIRQYAEKFVLCRECNKPDTKIVKEGEFTFLKCHACGAKRIIKSKIRQ